MGGREKGGERKIFTSMKERERLSKEIEGGREKDRESVCVQKWVKRESTSSCMRSFSLEMKM